MGREASVPRKKPVTYTTPARSIGRTAAIWHQGGEEVVRDVSVVLHLANGMDLVVKADDDVEVLRVQPEPITNQTTPDVGE
jgi:hypothetical protein